MHGETIRAQFNGLLTTHHQQNAEALERAVIKIEELFDQYRRGVDPLVEDMTSFGTRFGILRRMPLGWWYEDDRVRNFVQGKFEKHLFNEESLVHGLREVHVELNEALNANGNMLQGGTGILLRELALPDLTPEEVASCHVAIAPLMVDYASASGETSAMNGLKVAVASELAGYLGYNLSVQLASRLGTAAAATAASAGGATATGAAVGGSGGSLGGPASGIVALGIGVIIGVAVDWWMTERFRARLEAELLAYLNELEETLLYGDESALGLRGRLADLIQRTNSAREQALLTAITTRIP